MEKIVREKKERRKRKNYFKNKKNRGGNLKL